MQDIGRDDGLSNRLEELILTRAREIRAAQFLKAINSRLNYRRFINTVFRSCLASTPQALRKWQQRWQDAGCFNADMASDKPKYYVLEMFPYPSGRIPYGACSQLHIR